MSIKHTTLISDIAEDGLLSFSVNFALDKVYKEMFEVEYQSSQAEPDNIAHSIKMLIFGCFWLEAFTNRLLRVVLTDETRNERFRKSLWDTLKRTKFQEKLKIISTVGSDKETADFLEIDRNLGAAFELRNRLAHFKDNDQFVVGNLPADDIEKFFENAPESELIKHLRPPKIGEYASAIKDAGTWLTLIEQKYVKAEE